MPKTFAAAAILALSLLACGGGDDGEDADGGADASLADYSEEACETLLVAPLARDQNCCYSGGFQAGCGESADGSHMRDLDGTLGCVDQRVDGPVISCAFFACETFVDDVAECE
jgi:hypothetical protein